MDTFESVCKTKIRTINDLPIDEQEIYITKFINKNSKIIKKNLGFMMPVKLRKGIVGSMIMKIPEIITIERYMVLSDQRFSEGAILIPKSIHTAGNLILEKDFKQKGIFRVNSTKSRLRAAKTLLYEIVEERIDYEKGKRLFHKNFDLIDAAEIYKQLLREFNTTIVPEELLPMILKAQSITDAKEKEICTAALLFYLPYSNRKILESHVFMCYSIVEKVQERKMENFHMDISGISSVMMPNIFLKSSKNVAISDVLALVSFTKFLFREFKELIKIKPEYF